MVLRAVGSVGQLTRLQNSYGIQKEKVKPFEMYLLDVNVPVLNYYLSCRLSDFQF